MRKFCYDHGWAVTVDPKRGCSECRKKGWCPYYGKGCPC